jgi:hypothetical protein
MVQESNWSDIDVSGTVQEVNWIAKVLTINIILQNIRKIESAIRRRGAIALGPVYPRRNVNAEAPIVNPCKPIVVVRQRAEVLDPVVGELRRLKDGDLPREVVRLERRCRATGSVGRIRRRQVAGLLEVMRCWIPF